MAVAVYSPLTQPRSGCAYVNHNQEDTGDGERNFIWECMQILMILRPQKIQVVREGLVKLVGTTEVNLNFFEKVPENLEIS